MTDLPLTDVQTIYLVLAGFFLAEALYWLRPGDFLIYSWLGGWCRLATARTAAVIQNSAGGLVPCDLIPFGNGFRCQTWPVALSPDGVSSGVVQAPNGDRLDQPGRAVRFDDVRSASADGPRVVVNHRVLASVCSEELAAHLAAIIGRLAALPTSRRAAVIEEILAESLDETLVHARLEATYKHLGPLPGACLFLFCYVFGVIPGLLVAGDEPPLWKVATAYASILAVVVMSFVLAGRACRQADRTGPRISVWGHVPVMMVSPADAMHAGQTLVRDRLSRFQPLAVARALCPVHEVERLARWLVLDLRTPLPITSTDPVAVPIEQWFAGRLRDATEAAIRRAGFDPDALAAPGAPDDARCLGYCPRCLGQYYRADGTCTMCMGIMLNPLPGERKMAGC